MSKTIWTPVNLPYRAVAFLTDAPESIWHHTFCVNEKRWLGNDEANGAGPGELLSVLRDLVDYADSNFAGSDADSMSCASVSYDLIDLDAGPDERRQYRLMSTEGGREKNGVVAGRY